MTENTGLHPEYPYAPPPQLRAPPVHDGLAIAAFISVWFLPILGVILGHVSRGAAKREGRPPSGLATAAVIIGYIGLVLGALVIVMVIVAFAHASGQPVSCPTTDPAWPYC